MNSNFFEFCIELMGFTFHCKKSGNQIFKYEMFWSKLTPTQCFTNFNTKNR